MPDNLAIVSKVIRDLPEHSDTEVRMDSKLKEDLDMDSLDVVDLLVALEDSLHISMDDKSVEDIKTVGQLVEYLDKVSPNG